MHVLRPQIEMTWAISYAQQRRGVLRVLQWVEPRRNASRSNYSLHPRSCLDVALTLDLYRLRAVLCPCSAPHAAQRQRLRLRRADTGLRSLRRTTIRTRYAAARAEATRCTTRRRWKGIHALRALLCHCFSSLGFRTEVHVVPVVFVTLSRCNEPMATRILICRGDSHTYIVWFDLIVAHVDSPWCKRLGWSSG